MFKIAGLIFILALSVAAQRPPSQAELDSAKAVMETLVKWADAVRDRDMKTLDRLFADELFVTTSDGKTLGRSEELAALKPTPGVRTVSVTNENIRIKIYGDTAVVTALTKLVFVIKEKETSVAMRYTAVFVKRDGRWQIAALQTARS
jgi:uncharacterized protein (TIGR02246 family)